MKMQIFSDHLSKIYAPDSKQYPIFSIQVSLIIVSAKNIKSYSIVFLSKFENFD